ncbi:MAG: alpha/beta hydrolase [Chitinophagaceae bacterium]|nr:MAG: alpha/beta hydrolase [Chitinophagaceae bacterium]
MRVLFFAILLAGCQQVLAQDGAPTAAQVRQAIAGEIKSFNISPAKLYMIENTRVWNGTDSIPVRIYYPDSKKGLRIIYNIHGGALVAGDLDTHENISAELAVRTHSVVVAVDYRKPPEFPYPAGINDCKTVLDWIKKNAVKIHGNAADIVLLGDSGGGLFVTSLAVDMKKNLGVQAICLINPAVDLRTPGEGLYGLVTNWYLQGQSADDSLISPITATDFSDFPPTLIITCGKDELKPHGDAIYQKIRMSSTAKIFNIPDEDHLGGLWSAAHPRAAAAIDETVKFILSGYKYRG